MHLHITQAKSFVRLGRADSYVSSVWILDGVSVDDFYKNELHGVWRSESMSSHIIHANKTPVRGWFRPRLIERE
jgi:hypothetical protein